MCPWTGYCCQKWIYFWWRQKDYIFVTWLTSGSIGCSSRDTCTERSFKNFDDLVQKYKDSLPHLSGSGGEDPRAFRCDSPLLALSLFSKRKFAGGVFMQDFINECKEEWKHLIEIVNKNNVSVLFPRKCLLGNIEFSCMMVGKVSTQTEYFVLNTSFTRHSKTGQCHFNSSWKEASPSLRWVLTVLMSVYFWSKGKEYIYIDDKRQSLESNTGPSCWLASLLTTPLSSSLYMYIVIVHHCKTS